MTDKTELKVIAIALVIILAVFCTSLAISNITAQTKLNAIEIVARHHAQEDADWWQIVELAGGEE